MALPNNPTPAQLVKEVKALETNKMDKENPTGTGALSLNRAENSTVGTKSATIGNNNIASGENSFAEGESCTASGKNSHVEGNLCIASNPNTHAEGYLTTAAGVCSHAEGVGTIAKRARQHVFGSYNIEESGNSGIWGQKLEIVGNGNTDSSRSNARELYQNGDEWIAGKMTIAGGKISDGKNSSYRLAIPDTTSWTSDKTIATTDAVNGKQDKLPTTSTAGKVLKSTSTAGTLEWGDYLPLSGGTLSSGVGFGSTADEAIKLPNGVKIKAKVTNNSDTYYQILRAGGQVVEVGSTSHTLRLYSNGRPVAYDYSKSPVESGNVAFLSDIPNIPTTSTAGKVLKSTSTSGTVEWGALSASDVGALASNTTYVSSVNGSSGAVTGIETTSNKVTSISSQSTDTQYPSAKCVYDIVGNIETLLGGI